MKNYTSLKQIQEELYNNETSCKKLVLGYLKNISKQTKINAFVEVYESESLLAAEEIDKKIQNQTAGKLAGLVVGIKDNICYKNHSSTAASAILKNFKSVYSATVVKRLIAEDAIVLGRLNCDEFAMGSTTENSIYGPTRNPINLSYVAGGSSGGSAAAVKANLCQVSLGSDTGGSIRQPAAFCGVFGLKPTYGAVSRHGLIAFASSFDQIGPIAKSTDDLSVVMNVIAGKDDYDSTCIVEKPISPEPNKKYKIAIVKDALEFPGIHPGIKLEFEKLVNRLKEKKCVINEIQLPLLEHLVPTYYILTTAEASSNLSRYDGVKYGQQAKSDNLNELISQTRSLGFGDEVKRRVLLGTYVLSAGYYDAYYTKAQKIRRLIHTQMCSLLEKYDYILLPTTPNLPFPIGQHKLNPTKLYYEDVFTVPANLSGHPAISYPLGEVENGFFASAQIIGDYFSESKLLDFVEKIYIN